MIATHNPAGFIVSTGMKAYGEESGNDTVEGRARQIANRSPMCCSRNSSSRDGSSRAKSGVQDWRGGMTITR
jgi:hypothetical protein